MLVAIPLRAIKRSKLDALVTNINNILYGSRMVLKTRKDGLSFALYYLGLLRIQHSLIFIAVIPVTQRLEQNINRCVTLTQVKYSML